MFLVSEDFPHILKRGGKHMANDINLWDLLYDSAQRWPNKLALKQGNFECSYAELSERVCRMASFVLSEGLRKGDKAEILSPNSTVFVEAMFANAKIGVVTELLNWRLSPARLSELVERSSASLLFFSVKCADTYMYLRESVKRDVTFVCMDGEVEGAVSAEAIYAHEPDPTSKKGPSFEDPAIQIYSSGTTSAPKAMIHSVKNFVLKALLAAKAGNWSSDEIYLLTSPLFHSSCSGLFTCIASGATCILGTPSTESIINAITLDHATRVGVVPSVLNGILDYLEENPETDCSSVRSIEYGAAPMTAAQIARSMRFLSCGFYQYYGMTETVATVTVLLPEHHLDESKLKSVGIPVLGTRIKILKDDGCECAPNEPGEVVISHPCTITEYLDNPELTARSIKGDWYYSGDIGYLDEEGFLYLIDRKNDLIITGGENVYPSEVESCISDIDGVKAVAVTGVEDDRFGEAVMAAIVKNDGAALSEEAVLAHCKAHMAGYKKPRYIYFVDKLPLSATGKVDKKAVKAIHRRETN